MLRFVVALAAEARPLVDRYRLERVSGGGAFPIFRRGGTALVVSGVGKVAAAAATSYLHLSVAGAGAESGWINVGIGGHRRRPVGEAVIAHRIRDLASGRFWDLARLASAPCAGVEVLTVDRPEVAFREPGVYEMEASGFYPTARRFAASGLVHCLKVISDGPEIDPDALTRRRVAGLIEGQLEAVDRLAEACRTAIR